MNTDIYTTKNIKKIFLIAGEVSGDILGSELIKSLKILENNNIKFEFFGVAGELMVSAGIEQIFHSNSLSVMGFTEVLPSIPRIIICMNRVLQAIKRIIPDIIITIDSPSFNIRLAKKIRKNFGRKIPIIHYVAPTVWAYNANRSNIMAKIFDHILLLLPFEQEYFKNMPYTFVGHQTVYLNIQKNLYRNEATISSQRIDIRRSIGIHHQDLLITIMPGSRKCELLRHLPILKDAMQQITSKNLDKKVKFIIPTVTNLKNLVLDFLGNIENIEILLDDKKKDMYLAASDFAMVKSGTGVLEIAAFGVPMLAFYKASFLTELFLKNCLKIRYITLPNLLLNREVIPELVSQNCSAELIVECAQNIIHNQSKKIEQLKSFKQIIKMLQAPKGMTPSICAANVILQYL